MQSGDSRRCLALLRRPEYVKTFEALPAKYRSQIAKKEAALTHNPRPGGGGKTQLKGYDGICRARAGEWRIIYAYNDQVVDALTLRRRDESTYDDLDELEIGVVGDFRSIKGNGARGHDMEAWEKVALERSAPKPRPDRPLPKAISEAMLDKLGVPREYWQLLTAVKSEDGLLECEAVPYEEWSKVHHELFGGGAPPDGGRPQPVVVLEDLIDSKATAVAGPVDVSESGSGGNGGARPPKGTGGGGKPPSPPQPPHFAFARSNDPMKPYPGNTAKGIAKDARYTVKLDGTIQLVFEVGEKEHALLTTDAHPELVAMVNEAKQQGGSQQGAGGFVINEYRHVLVPTSDRRILFAGRYTHDLEFTFEGNLISPVAPPSIHPGAIWPGPHVGIKYTLAAGAKDVRYEFTTERGTSKTVALTDYHSAANLEGLLGALRAVKPNGGAIYINEARELFAPVDDGSGYKRRYIGHLGGRPWFPEPS